MSACRSCGAPVLWALNGATKRGEPLDAEPRDDGNIEIVAHTEIDGRRVPVAHHLTKDERDQHSLIARHRYVSHFATCPNANDWRKRG